MVSGPFQIFPCGSDSKASAYNVGDPGSNPGSGSSPGEGNGTPVQYSSWKIPWTEKPGRLQSWTWLSNFTSLHFRFFNYSQVIFICLYFISNLHVFPRFLNMAPQSYMLYTFKKYIHLLIYSKVLLEYSCFTMLC